MAVSLGCREVVFIVFWCDVGYSLCYFHYNMNFVLNNLNSIYNESLQACNELGFKDDEVLPLISKFINEEGIKTSDDVIKKILQRMG